MSHRGWHQGVPGLFVGSDTSAEPRWYQEPSGSPSFPLTFSSTKAMKQSLTSDGIVSREGGGVCWGHCPAQLGAPPSTAP